MEEGEGGGEEQSRQVGGPRRKEVGYFFNLLFPFSLRFTGRAGWSPCLKA
jgi:hypothetical protein